MADIKSFPNNQSTYVGAEWVMRWLHGRTSGVFAAAGNAAVSAVQGAMQVAVSDGLGWIANAEANGVVWWNDTYKTTGVPLTLDVPIADGALDRIDRVIVEWETTNYVALPQIKVLVGTPAATPSAPALTNNNVLRQISLARLSIPAGTVAMTASMITDERLDDTVCGLVTESLTIDTSMVQAQMQELLETIEEELREINDGSGVVISVNGKGGVVTLDAEDVGAVEAINGKSGTSITLDADDVGALPVPTIVEDVWDTKQGGAANFDSTATFEVSGSGFVLVQDNTWIDPLSASDYGSTNVTITYNGAVVASAGVRTTSTHSEMQGAYVEYPANVSSGDTFVLTERHTKGGTKHARRRFVCFGCTVTKTA